ncbi:MAG: transporter substrate-binding domain-containing protein [Sneathiella sp.]
MRDILGRKIVIYILSFVLTLGMAANVIAASKKEHSSETVRIALCEFHITHKFAQFSVAEAYRQLGLNIEFQELPCRRSLIEANAGRFDGEVARIRGVTKNYENLLQLESPTILIEGVAFSRKYDLSVTKWADLSGFTIGIVRGELYAEKGTAGLNPTVVDSYDQLLSLVALGRLDIGVAIKRDFEISENSAKFKDYGLKIVSEPLFSAPLFHLVHKKNKLLVKDLNKIFKKMWDSGETRKIHTNTMKRMLHND